MRKGALLQGRGCWRGAEGFVNGVTGRWCNPKWSFQLRRKWKVAETCNKPLEIKSVRGYGDNFVSWSCSWIKKWKESPFTQRVCAKTYSCRNEPFVLSQRTPLARCLCRPMRVPHDHLVVAPFQTCGQRIVFNLLLKPVFCCTFQVFAGTCDQRVINMLFSGDLQFFL